MFDRTLILCPKRYSVYDLLHSILSGMSGEIRGFDVNDQMGKRKLWLNAQAFRFPGSVRGRWERSFLRTANECLLREINDFNPDLVLVYNSEYLLPETCASIRKKSKMIFYLGDSPFYTPHSNWFLASLTYADLILAPDSFWISQLNTVGLSATMHFIPGIDEKLYFRVPDDRIPAETISTEILYVGANYLNSWGFKKAMLMSKFTAFDLRIYGNSAWKRWFDLFPELKPAFVETGYLDTARVNLMFNRTKIVPVDGNPAIINGVHLRLMEALGAGTLPLTEYRQDIDKLIFEGSGLEIPFIRDYGKAADIAGYWLRHDREREETADAMRSFVMKRYSSAENAARLSERLLKG
ncbi:hypothetical protein EG830_02275 [bacterium]|nr:hypothetical protein [bacterium]